MLLQMNAKVNHPIVQRFMEKYNIDPQGSRVGTCISVAKQYFVSVKQEVKKFQNLDWVVHVHLLVLIITEHMEAKKNGD